MLNLETINKFAKELSGEYYKEIVQADFDRKLNQGTTKFMTLDKNGETISLATLHFVESITRKSLVIEDLIVAEEYREQGWGKDLVEQIIKLGEKMEVDCIEVCTKKNNKKARRLYEKQGFKERNNVPYRLWLKK